MLEVSNIETFYGRGGRFPSLWIDINEQGV
jgi:hypothetical protein